MGSLIYQHQDFADAITILAAGGIDQGRHITAEIPLQDIVSRGFIPLSEQKGAHIKVQVDPRYEGGVSRPTRRMASVYRPHVRRRALHHSRLWRTA